MHKVLLVNYMHKLLDKIIKKPHICDFLYDLYHEMLDMLN